MPIERRYGGSFDSGLPSSRISPSVGVSKPASIISVVVLPDPEGPSSVRNSPRRMSRSRWSTTRVSPSYVLPMPTKRTIGSDMLAAVDGNLRPGQVRRARRAEELDQVGGFLRRAEAMHRNVALDDLRSTRRQDCRIDLAGRDCIDAHTERCEVMRHFARQC